MVASTEVSFNPGTVVCWEGKDMDWRIGRYEGIMHDDKAKIYPDDDPDGNFTTVAVSRLHRVTSTFPPKPKKVEKSDKKKKKLNAHRTHYHLFNTFMDRWAKELSHQEALVWLTLLRDSRDGEAQTSMRDITARTGVNPMTVHRTTKSLVRKGLLIVKKKGRRHHGASIYTLKV